MRVGDQRGLGVQFFQPLGPVSPVVYRTLHRIRLGPRSTASSEGRRIRRFALYRALESAWCWGANWGPGATSRWASHASASPARTVIPEEPDGPSFARLRHHTVVPAIGSTRSTRWAFPSRGYLVDAPCRTPAWQNRKRHRAGAFDPWSAWSAISTEELGWPRVWRIWPTRKSGASPLSPRRLPAPVGYRARFDPGPQRGLCAAGDGAPGWASCRSPWVVPCAPVFRWRPGAAST